MNFTISKFLYKFSRLKPRASRSMPFGYSLRPLRFPSVLCGNLLSFPEFRIPNSEFPFGCGHWTHRVCSFIRHSIFIIQYSIFVLFLFSLPAHAAPDCSFKITVSDPTNTGFGPAAQAALAATLARNGCRAADAESADALDIKLTITNLESKKRLNLVGIALAGGLSSTFYTGAESSVSLEAGRNGETVFSETADFRNSPPELFSAWRRAGAIKKHTVEGAAMESAMRLLEKLGVENPVPGKPSHGRGDLLAEDSDIWPVLGGGWTSTAIHDFGHVFDALLLGHDAHLRKNKNRTFKAGTDASAMLSLFFAPHTGDDMLFPFPDVFYDFGAYQTPQGVQYLDENTVPVSHGRRDHAIIAYSGLLYQNLTNEYLLTKNPDLINMDRPFKKGMFFGNIIVPAFYTFQGYGDDNSDLMLLQRDLDWPRWAVNAMVLTPLAIDLYRYYHPEKKRLRRWARIAKILPVIVCLTK